MTGKAGAVLLRERERQTKLLERFAQCFEDHRQAGKVEHSVAELIAQRVYSLLLGEEPAPRQEGFVLQKRRWVVERTFGWLSKFRRLAKDYEAKTWSSRTWILLAANAIMLSRLAG